MDKDYSDEKISELGVDNSETFSDRLKTVFLPNMAADVSKKCNIPESTLRKYLKGTVPSIAKAATISEALGVSLLWLATGNQGEPINTSSNDAEEMSEFDLIPGYDIQVAAGNGIAPEGERTTRKLAFRRKWLKYRGLAKKDLVLVFTKGDSMEPTISDNNTLMIDTSKVVLNDGGIYVIRTNDHLVVKRIQTTLKGFFLMSDNKEYERIEVTYNEADDLQVIGKVVWIGKDV